MISGYEELNLVFVQYSISVSAALPVLCGLIQIFFPGAMKSFLVFGQRIPSTLGNPNFFGAYLAAVLPVIVKSAMDSKKILKWLLYALAVTAVICLAMTGSKAAYAGVFVEFIATLYLMLRHRGCSVKKSVLTSGAAVLLAALFLPAVFKVPYGKAFDAAAWMKNESVFFRANTWAGTMDMIKSKWLFGSGPGAFYLDFPRFRPAALMLWSGEHSYEITQPENILLQTAAETGIPGLAILLFIIWLTAPVLKNGKNAFNIGLCGLFVVNLFGVDLNYMPSAMMLFLYAGIVFNGSGSKKETGISDKKYFVLIPAAALLAAIIFFQISFHVSDVNLKSAINYSQSGDWQDAIKLYEASLDKNKYNITAGYFLASAYADSKAPGSIQKALDRLNGVEKLAPDYVLLHYKKASIYAQTGEKDLAEEEYRKMLRTDPYFKPALVELALLYYSKRDMPSAEQCLLKAAEKYNNDASIYNNLANIYFMEKRPADAVLAYKKAIEINPNKDYYYNLSCVYYSLGDHAGAKKCIKEAAESDTTGDPKIRKMMNTLNLSR
jgi:tetratricopeptide (TPR) repeat protein